MYSSTVDLAIMHTVLTYVIMYPSIITIVTSPPKILHKKFSSYDISDRPDYLAADDIHARNLREKQATPLVSKCACAPLYVCLLDLCVILLIIISLDYGFCKYVFSHKVHLSMLYVVLWLFNQKSCVTIIIHWHKNWYLICIDEWYSDTLNYACALHMTCTLRVHIICFHYMFTWPIFFLYAIALHNEIKFG